MKSAPEIAVGVLSSEKRAPGLLVSGARMGVWLESDQETLSLTENRDELDSKGDLQFFWAPSGTL